MTSLKQVQMDMEPLATVREVYLFESPRETGRVLLIVALEQAHITSSRDSHQLKPDFEYFRARAEMPQGHGKHFDLFGNSISVTVCHNTQTVMFGPTSQIQMYPEGHGLGPALMARVIAWLHATKLQAYTVQSGLLSSATVGTPEERIRRNRFYTNVGFTVTGSNLNQQPAVGDDVVNGQFIAQTVGQLQVPSDYFKRLQRSSSFYSQLVTERYVAQQNVWELEGIKKWAKGSSTLAVIKRVVLFVMGSDIGRR